MNYAIILSGGTGSRVGSTGPHKQFIKIAGKTVIEHTIEIFEKCDLIDKIIIVTHESDLRSIEDIIKSNSFSKVFRILRGGRTRQESSKIGVFAIEDDDSAKILIHDAVRPLLSYDIIFKCVKELDQYQVIDVAIPASDTIIRISDDFIINKIPERKYLMRGQTPQGFKLGVIKKAHEMADEENFKEATDDCGLVLRYELAPIKVIEGNEYNIKITYPVDVYLADRLFQLKTDSPPLNNDYLKMLKNKTIVIFGGSEGIGKHMAEIANTYDAKVFPCSRRLGVDITDFREISRFIDNVVQETGSIDFVVNTAAVLRMAKINTTSIEEIDNDIKCNLNGVFYIIKSSYPHLLKSKGSILLFTSSSYTRGRALYSVYSSTKAAIVNIVQALSDEFSPHSIRINAINPERTNTPMRIKNFGIEPEETLLSPSEVAIESLKVLVSKKNGEIVDIRKR